MIAEQDFIIRLRRMHRLNLPQIVVNIARDIPDYNAAEVDSDKVLGAMRSVAVKAGAEFFVMGNGDVFVIFPALDPTTLRQLQEKLVALAFPQNPPADPAKALSIYAMPSAYTELREKANSYVELERASEVMGPVQEATLALQAEDVRGPLTAWSLSQVEKLLDNTDIKRYVRTQPVYIQNTQGIWEKDYIDFFVSVTDLKRERFPRLNLEAPERLFLELCCTLDRILLLQLANQVDSWADKRISLNLSAETVLSPGFAQFCHVLPNARRAQVRFEIHRSDLFLNFTTSRNAIQVLQKEGFTVAIDGITPSVLPYIHFGRLNADFYKVNVTREKWPEMEEPEVLKALQSLPSEKIIFSHCDHEEALRRGRNLGVRYYQGWLIDDVANAIVT